MAKDYSGQDLSGRRFAGQDLRGGVFRGADLRRVSFRGADLTGADLYGTRLDPLAIIRFFGLEMWPGIIAPVLFLFAFHFVASAASLIRQINDVGFGTLHPYAPIQVDLAYADLPIAAAVIVGLCGILAFALRIGRFADGLSLLGLALTTSAVGFVMVSHSTGAWLETIENLVGTVSGAVAAISVAVLLLTLLSPIGQALPLLLLVIVGIVIAVQGTEPATLVKVMVAALGSSALALTSLAWYLRRHALAENQQLRGLRRLILAAGAWYGSDLRDALMPSANLENAQLRFVKLAATKDLTRTRFRGARDLHLAYVTGTILANRRVRELLVSGDAAGGHFEHADLHGAWLGGANLRGTRFCDAELTGADLTDADLTDADLSRATLIGADLTGATLTGACLDGWNIDTDTQLVGVRADYVFLEAGPDGTRRERRPQGEGLFGPGDFTTLFERALKTVDLIFRDGVDWDAFRSALHKLRVHYEADGRGQEVRVQAIENTADGRIIIRVAVPDGGDKDADYRRILEDYRQQVAALEHARERLALEHKVELADDQIRHALELLEIERRHKGELVAAERRSSDRLLEGFIDDHVTVHQQHIMAQNFYQYVAEAGQVATGDIVNKTVNQSGNFSGSIINIDTRLERVTQGIGTLPNLDADTRACLTGLVEQLRAALARVSTERAADAEAVAVFTSDLLEKAATEPNESVLRISANKLLETARSLADQAAPVVKLVEQILGLLGLG